MPLTMTGVPRAPSEATPDSVTWMDSEGVPNASAEAMPASTTAPAEAAVGVPVASPEAMPLTDTTCPLVVTTATYRQLAQQGLSAPGTTVVQALTPGAVLEAAQEAAQSLRRLLL